MWGGPLLYEFLVVIGERQPRDFFRDGNFSRDCNLWKRYLSDVNVMCAAIFIEAPAAIKILLEGPNF